ncbi:tRNA modification GTPase trmE [Hasllibacter halocynthiae]|uniref:tRNA modification GTPase MnmE n=1 Tax=Hasllibacter halocynthiae TaxID=595589 RepID=A0A2T0X2F1_9RHOB|nr:tRNA uridine-5-carboxymethylaminomethyl(34) synthesis GTPase MnmE [Hasllibacter halocynthiae]PRY93126.1 tRNA modification GTPase trmE [Hasllibacter halocynthiae]
MGGDTIFALATARGKAGVAVLRLSGPDAAAMAEALCGPLPPPRRAGLRDLRHDGELIDRPLVLRFEAGASFTGEAVVELHLHGAPVIADRVMDLLEGQGARPAGPGEFTRRAFANGTLDLLEVEGLGDLLDAETEAQRRQAMRLAGGDAETVLSRWKDALTEALAWCEASLEFDDGDIPEDVRPKVREIVDPVLAELAVERRGIGAAERIRDGFTVALIGAPNVGKSTLINKIAGREIALVSPEAGTTRDRLEVPLDLRGLAVRLVDTAGIREADGVERLGIDRALEVATEADLRVYLGPPPPDAPEPRSGDILVAAKADLSTVPDGVSGLTGEGVDRLLDRIAGTLSRRAASSGTFARRRHADLLAAFSEAMASVIAALEADALEIAAEGLWSALHVLDRLLGRTDVEDVLDRLFASFCIGK